MPTLKPEPSQPVRSLGEFFAIALALETEAAARYGELAQNMRDLGLPDVAAVFDHLVAEEGHHAGAIERWSREATGAAPNLERLRWRPADAFDEEAAQGIASSRLASAYRALSFAVRNEERAFLLWTHIAALAEDPAIHAAAEAIAIEELRHAAMLRQERRRAFHDARRSEMGTRPAAPSILATRAVEQELAAGLAALARMPDFAASASELERLAAEAQVMAGGAVTGVAAEDATRRAADEAPDLASMRRLAERAAELYLEAADAAHDEQMLRHLQSSADKAIARIARLGAMTGEH